MASLRGRRSKGKGKGIRARDLENNKRGENTIGMRFLALTLANARFHSIKKLHNRIGVIVSKNVWMIFLF